MLIVGKFADNSEYSVAHMHVTQKFEEYHPIMICPGLDKLTMISLISISY